MSIPVSVKNLKAPYDSLTLRAVTTELRERIVGGQVQDVRQPSASELRIGIRSQGRSHTLALSCDARFARVHLTSQRSPNAATPSAFCMALRKHCVGAIVCDVRQREFDRIFELELAPRGDSGEPAGPTLIAELMGKHSNLILVSASGTVLEAAKRISRRVNRFREVLPGVAYQPPPAQLERQDPFDPGTVSVLVEALAMEPASNPEARAEWLVKRVSGVSPFLSVEIATRLFAGGEEDASALPSTWESIFGAAARGEFRPVSILAGGRPVAAYPFPLTQAPPEAQSPAPDLSAALDAAYSGEVQRAGDSALVAELRGLIERDRKRLLRQREMAERTRREGGRAEEYKQSAELILANLWQIVPGEAKATVQDYFDPGLGMRTIGLDPKLSAQENADALFRRYRKVRDGQEVAETRYNEATAQLQALDAALEDLDETERDGRPVADEAPKLRASLRARGLLAERGPSAGEAAQGPDMQGHKIRRFTTPEGYEIYLGETATANDFLTTRLASSNDLWLHVRASTSAHVVVKTQGKPESVPRSVLEYAALLCARHSSQKHSGLVPVDWTLKKYVRKPRGAAPGSADYHHETTLHVTP